MIHPLLTRSVTDCIKPKEEAAIAIRLRMGNNSTGQKDQNINEVEDGY